MRRRIDRIVLVGYAVFLGVFFAVATYLYLREKKPNMGIEESYLNYQEVYASVAGKLRETVKPKESMYIKRNTDLDKYSIDDKTREDIAFILSETGCREIVAGHTINGDYYCDFSDDGFERRKGVVFVGENLNALSGAYADSFTIGLSVVERRYINPTWAYYEGLTYYGEKAQGG